MNSMPQACLRIHEFLFSDARVFYHMGSAFDAIQRNMHVYLV
jgi:hypothetical protein